MINNTINFHTSALGAFVGYKLSSYLLTFF